MGGCSHYVTCVYVVTTDRLSNLFFGFAQANFIGNVMESIRQCSNIACQKKKMMILISSMHDRPLTNLTTLASPTP